MTADIERERGNSPRRGEIKAARKAALKARRKREKAMRKKGRTLDGLLRSNAKTPCRTGPAGRISTARKVSGGGVNGTGKRR